MPDDEPEDPAAHRARLKADKRTRKHGRKPMAVTGKSVFLIKQIIEARARAARENKRKRSH